MIISTDILKDVSTKVLAAVDTSELSTITESVELYVENDALNMCVTNKEYFVRTKIFLGYTEDFHATVNANLFLKLISQITTESVELSTTKEYLLVKANGSYKIPLIYVEESLMRLPEIAVENIANEFNIEGSTLHSILKYNAKELQKGFISKPVQRLFYIDDNGAITFTTGACVNYFQLPQPVRLLLPLKVVKLFKLFKPSEDEEVKFTLGHSILNDSFTQTRVRFGTADTELTVILNNNDALVNSVPVDTIRSWAASTYPIKVTLNQVEVLQAINRLSLFVKKASTDLTCTLDFSEPGYLTLFGGEKSEKAAEERIKLSEENIPPYHCSVYIDDLRATLEALNSSHVILKTGEGRALTITKDRIVNVIPLVIKVGD